MGHDTGVHCLQNFQFLIYNLQLIFNVLIFQPKADPPLADECLVIDN